VRSAPAELDASISVDLRAHTFRVGDDIVSS
jgi:hypothetical protein